MGITEVIREQWTNLIGASASVGLFIYNVFKPTKFAITPQSGIGDTIISHPVTVGLGAIAVIGFGIFAAIFIYKQTHRRGRR